MLLFFPYLFVTVFYWLNQTRFLYGGDSAEYVTIGQTWSLAHPPGYPFYSFLLNFLRIIFPSLTPIQIANILSITPTVITGYIIFLTLKTLKVDKIISFLTSLIYFFIFPIWLYSEVPEVFALNNLIISLITFLIIKGRVNDQYSFWIFFLFGLAIAHHHTFLIFLPGWYFLIKNKNKFIREKLFKKIFLMGLGFSFYLYAPIAASFHPPIDYENPTNFERFLKLITRASYGTFKAYTTSVPDLFNQLTTSFLSFVYLVHDLRILGIISILFGLFFIFKTDKKFFKFIMITFFLHLIFYLYTNFPLSNFFIAAIFERFLISLYYILIFPLAFGFNFFKKIIDRIVKIYIKNIFFKKIIFYSFYFFILGYLTIIFNKNYKIIKNLKNLNYFDSYAKNLLSTPPKGAIFYSGSDSGVFTTSFYYYVKKYRTDLKFISFGLINRQYYQEKIKNKYPEINLPNKNTSNYTRDFLIKNYQYGIYTESPIVDGSWAPYGLLWKYYIHENAAKKDVNFLIKKNIELWNNYKIPIVDNLTANLIHFKSLQEVYINKFITFINFLRTYKKYNEAIHQIKKVINKDKITHPSVLSLSLILYAEKKDCLKAKETKSKYFNQPNLENTDVLKSLITYYYYCEPKNKNLIDLVNIYRRKNKSESLILEKL